MKLTISLIIITTLIFIISLNNLDYFISNYGFSTSNFLGGKYYIIITSIFLHSGWSHLIYNMIALFFLGIVVEKNVGAWKYLLVYFVSGIAGNLSLFIPFFGYSSDTLAIGASGAISGLVGLGAFMFPGEVVIFPTAFPIPFILAGVIFFLVNLSNLFNPSGIAYSAHLFGLLGGAFFGVVWGENRIKKISVFILLLLLITGIPLIIGYFL